MSEREIVFSPRARERLEDIVEYLYGRHLSSEFVLKYVQQIESWLERLLGTFPESGNLIPEFGEDVRRVVYKKYCFLYRIQEDRIEILTVYRGNLP